MTNIISMSFLPDYVFPEFLFVFFIAEGVSSSLASVWGLACVFLLHFSISQTTSNHKSQIVSTI